MNDRQPNIELHIEELILEGVNPADRARIGDAVEQELTRMLASGQGITSSSIDHVNAGTRRLGPRANATAIGNQVARAVHGGLTR